MDHQETPFSESRWPDNGVASMEAGYERSPLPQVKAALIDKEGEEEGEINDHGADETGENEVQSRLTFQIDDRPPIHIAIFYGLQIILSNLPPAVALVFIIHRTVCGGKDYEFLAKLMSGAIFMAGFSSLLQVLFGVRLPITQGSSFIFIPPIVAMVSTAKWKCLETTDIILNGTLGHPDINGTSEVLDIVPEWQPIIARVSGGLAVAALVQFLFGITGIAGMMMSLVGPITLAPTIMLIGISLFPFAAKSSEHHWGVALGTIALTILFSTVLGNVQVPILIWSRKKGFHSQRYPLIRMFANLLAIVISWVICHILTVSGQLTEDADTVGYMTRTDAKLDAVKTIQWLYFPYPGQFGAPVFAPDIFGGMLAVTISSMVESIGDYHATARIAEIPNPPKHAINRGVAMEGLATMFSALIGCCHGTTSYSNAIGFISYTGVASRFTWIIMSIILMSFAVIGKLAGFLATIPEPIIGGATLLGLALVVMIGISQLHSVDLMATRNQMAVGVAIMLGVTLPTFFHNNPGVINTGSADVDSVLFVFLSTAPFVSGFTGFVMDNILPGTKKERGMLPEEEGCSTSGHKMSVERIQDIYGQPRLNRFLAKYPIFTYIPISPTYINRPCSCCRNVSCCRRRKSPK